MVFKFSNDITLDEARKKNRSIKKGVSFNNKIVFINGFGASGKTMLSPIISSMDRVESPVFPYEIQWISSFLYSSKMDEKSYSEFIRQYCDNTIYNLTMGRNSNFRFSDISSIFQSPKRFKFLKRIFEKGDNASVDEIKIKKPIINFTSSALLLFINEIATSLSNRVLFIETFRDPLYMFKQAKINHKEVHVEKREKNFTFEVFEENERSFYFDYYSNINQFRNLDLSKSNEQVVKYLERMYQFYFNFDFNKIDMKGGKLICLPFEKFVLGPDKWIDEILSFLDIRKTKNLIKELKKQKVPRKILIDGYSRSVYKRYSQYPIKKKYTNFSDADNDYKEQIKLEFGKNEITFFNQLVDLSNKYRDWSKKFENKISWN
tara:strand:- start:1264 stop:2391 length:1128 start_codon:yes stop_codon:yes gene_type:complete